MKIVHTSDWHAGRIWKGLNRLDELAACLDQIAAYVEREAVDLLLVTGDVFDSGAPAARAERLVFQFFRRVGETGAQSVVIAGNHDSPDRFEAWGTLTELIQVRAIGRPKRAQDGGVLELTTKGGERAVIAAIPFASQRWLVNAVELARGDDVAMKSYSEKLSRLIASLCQKFRSDTVNLLCLHTHLEGAIKAGSERQVHVGEDWAALPATLPANAHYIALGHLHQPQSVAAPSPAFYAGSPLQLDFGEADQEKSFVVVEAQPRPIPARIRRVPYIGGRRLLKFTGTFQELEQRAPEIKENAWLRVVVRVDQYDPELNRRVRSLLPNAVSVDQEARSPLRESAQQQRDDSYEAFHLHRYGRPPSAELMRELNALRERAEAVEGEREA
ncbi:MAG: exonuclease SbcCD subunit D [Bryobacteraceae bacterium]|nr:exonuclease SbcCD subunit D [Bryobacteraceae bacterium]MDW8377354.1 exonuclease SbcCD subunit D [Bryobacterales bacterium]